MEKNVDLWWEDHHGLKTDVMELIVRDWSHFKTPEEIREHLRRFFQVRTDWIPCDVEEFITDFIEYPGFWPAF